MRANPILCEEKGRERQAENDPGRRCPIAQRQAMKLVLNEQSSAAYGRKPRKLSNLPSSGHGGSLRRQLTCFARILKPPASLELLTARNSSLARPWRMRGRRELIQPGAQLTSWEQTSAVEGLDVPRTGGYSKRRAN